MVEQRFQVIRNGLQIFSESTAEKIPQHQHTAVGRLKNCSVCKYSNEERKRLRAMLKNKDAAVKRMHDKLCDQEQLRSEAKTLHEDLDNDALQHVRIGNEAMKLATEHLNLSTSQLLSVPGERQHGH